MMTRRTCRATLTVAAMSLTIILAGCSGVQDDHETQPTPPDRPSATRDTSAPTPSSATPAESPTSLEHETTPGALVLPACILSDEAFEAVVGTEVLDSDEVPKYGYVGDKGCFYSTKGPAWYVYVLPEDGGGDSAWYQRRWVEAEYSDVTPFTLDGSSNAIVFKRGHDAMFTTREFVIIIEAVAAETRGYGEELARAMAAEIAAL